MGRASAGRAGPRPVAVAPLGSTASLESAKARLDMLALYPRPVRIERVRVIVSPRLFRLPWFRRFDGYAAWGTILLREPPVGPGDDLLCHELCHVWQMQHHPIAMPLSYLRTGYEGNPYEAEARAAVEATLTGRS
jgi:hypothetical protein